MSPAEQAVTDFRNGTGEPVNHNTIREFYSRSPVRKRIAEYLGAGTGGEPSCLYLAQPDSGWPRLERIHAPRAFPSLLDSGRDLSRSLWDRTSLIAHLNIKYVNFEYPHEAYMDPVRTFRLQDPVHAVAERILSRHGIERLRLVTGRGYHYVWRIDCRSDAFTRLRRLGRCNDTLLKRHRVPGLPIP